MEFIKKKTFENYTQNFAWNKYNKQVITSAVRLYAGN